MNNTKSIMIVGVGGQGSLLASKLLGTLLVSRGCDVKVSEVHGMAQRGGSVVTYVKYGGKVSSPIIERGEADVLIAFELCEAARWSAFLKEDGILIANAQRIMPMPVITGAAQYPQGLEEGLGAVCKNAWIVDALTPAGEAGSARAVNVVLMGLLSRLLDIPEAEWQSALEACLKPALVPMNQKAFQSGRALFDQMQAKA